MNNCGRGCGCGRHNSPAYLPSTSKKRCSRTSGVGFVWIPKDIQGVFISRKEGLFFWTNLSSGWIFSSMCKVLEIGENLVRRFGAYRHSTGIVCEGDSEL